MTRDPACHALLLQPPPGDVTGPYPALGYLKSYAAQKGYQVSVKDLGIDALLYLSHPERVAGMLDRVREQCGRLEASPSLDAGQQRRYGRLLAALAGGDQPQWVTDSLQAFRNPAAFFDYPRYKQARNGLGAFFGMLSALHDPTHLTPAVYPTATMLKTMQAIQAHQEPALNPYIEYYEAVLMPLIAACQPAVVGISMVFANQSVQALVLGRVIKERFPHIHVTLGGAYLSQWVMTADDSHVARLLTCADSIVCGEGEEAFTDLLRCVLKNESPAGQPNLITPGRDPQQVIRFAALGYTDIANQPPPDFSDLDLAAYLAPQTIIPYCVSRGCYWGRCVFCQNRYGDHRIRRYQTVPVDKAIDEMRRLADQYGSHHFNFSNDVVDPAYLKALSRAILDSGRSFVWHTDLRAENVFDEKTCRLMASAGLTSVAIGFESGCQKTLDAMDKGKRVEITAQVMGNLYRAGVATQAMGIFGMPGESEADGAQTVRFLEANSDHISYYVIGLLMVLPGSRMHDDPEAYGVSAIRYDHNPLQTPEPVWFSETRMSPASVNRLYARLNNLEAIYAIDEYPYVGGLSTNHGFLYYTRGPDILKRLRQEEQAAAAHTERLLGMDGSPVSAKSLRKITPRLVVPFVVQRSRFALQRLSVEDGPALVPATQGDFLLLPDCCQPVPVMMGPGEIGLLRRIDGRRNLSAVLKKVAPAQLKRALSFVAYLARIGAVEWA
jgi:anaerobic magnesium-protoporphyrin IX monomethyl ester cyclase